jgi:hypothetical protein
MNIFTPCGQIFTTDTAGRLHFEISHEGLTSGVKVVQ